MSKEFIFCQKCKKKIPFGALFYGSSVGTLCHNCFSRMEIIASNQSLSEKARDLICLERERQKDLWGDQNHLPLPYLYLIVAEERGELAEAILETDLEGKYPERGGLEKILTEAIHSAATSMKLIEAVLLKMDELHVPNIVGRPFVPPPTVED